MHFFLNRTWLTALLIMPLAALFLTTAAYADDDDDDRGNRRSMTGVWVSTAPAWWVVRYELGVLAGDVQMRWELEEDENGLINGFNIWHAPNPEEGVLGIGAMCMVGARNGSHVVISEAGIFNATACSLSKGRIWESIWVIQYQRKLLKLGWGRMFRNVLSEPNPYTVI